jgi:hypothetical protein
MVERMGESGDPWGVPCEMVVASDVNPLKVIRTCWSVRKEWVHMHMAFGKPRLVMVLTNLLMLRLSKNPCISKRINAAQWPVLIAISAWWMRHMMASTVQ